MRQFFKSLISLILSLKAKRVVVKNKARLILIVGSDLRNSFKNEIAEFLKASGVPIKENLSGYNYKLGLPLTILGQKAGFSSPWKWLKLLFSPAPRFQDGQVLLLEFSYTSPKDWNYILNFLPLEVLIISDLNIPRLSRFSSKYMYLKELQKLVEEVCQTRKVIVPDDFSLPNTSCKVISFGFKKDSDLRLINSLETKSGQVFELKISQKIKKVSLNKFGIHYALPQAIANYLKEYVLSNSKN